MKKIFYFSLLTLVATVSTNAQKNKSQKAEAVAPAPAFVPSVEGPEIQFENMVYDYGQIEQGANGDCEFKFKNIGSEPLVLSNVQASCGCTTPQWPREPIMPGQDAVIKVHYDTNRLGYIGKSITVYTNGKTDRAVLRIAGNVNPKQN